MNKQIKQILKKLEEAQEIFSKLNPLERDDCLNGFSECYSLNHCINQGLNCCDELLSRTKLGGKN